MVDYTKNQKESYGGLQVMHRNYNALSYKNSVVYFNLYRYCKIGMPAKVINLLFCNYPGLIKKNEQRILELGKVVDFVWMDSSLQGKLSKKIKSLFPKIKIITFFHNCEYEYNKCEQKIAKCRQVFVQLKNLILSYIIKKNERWTCQYSDKIIVLNERDKLNIQNIYGRTADVVIPISFPNKQIEFSNERISSIPVALFLGSNFFANIHGIKWFIRNVLPFVNIKLKIVGRDMDNANLPKSEKLEVLGYVEDLDEYMQNADFIVLPIFIGGGMKVKTCESLMHGKNIIGTHEAFEGYDVDFEKVGACCETAEEFITAINEFPRRFANKFNEYSRNVFLEKYTDDITFRQIAEVFKE